MCSSKSDTQQIIRFDVSLSENFIKCHQSLEDRAYTKREPTRSMTIWVNIFQAEFIAEIYSESPARAIGKVLLLKFN